ncbi:MAG: branched-chain amino acid ABC transporter permease [Oscillospiraceae bacterium]|nr:branched-chain amino acid ABC transporter permease [Oscillospiraceae bacterium]MBR3952242.1 branched-chain amino acid ABC transporter permease [Oscillospiraceae bacterium]
MEKLKNVKWNHYLNYIVVAAVTLVFAILSLTGVIESSDKYLLEKVAIAITLAVSLSMVVGFLGELSLGHAGFMCIGAYLGGKTAVILEPVIGEWPALIVSLLVGGIVAAVFGMIIGLPALRLRGDYLAIVTLAFGEIVRSVFMNSSKESFGGSLGLDTPRFDKDILFVIAFVMVLATLAVTQNLIRSKHGRAITAIRDNEIAARATGIDVTKYKLLVFTVSSFFAGIAGVLYSYSNFTVQSTKFSYNYSIEILVMVVLGGMGSINGAIIAATLITFLDVELQTILTGNLAVLQDLIYALILIVLVIYNNAPALKNFREKYNLKAFINKFRPHVPSKHKDDEAKWDRVPTKIKMDEVLSVDFQTTSPYAPDKPGKEEK